MEENYFKKEIIDHISKLKKEIETTWTKAYLPKEYKSRTEIIQWIEDNIEGSFYWGDPYIDIKIIWFEKPSDAAFYQMIWL